MSTVFGIADVDRIVAFAKRFSIFPCRARIETITDNGRTRTYHPKSPLTHNGFHAATQEPTEIRAWWRQWPEALVGVPTGQASGLVVLDYDPDKATQATHEWMAEHTDLLCSSRAHKTARNGLHYLFASTDRYQTGTDLLLNGSPRKGIDLRANGGYVIWWPLHGGEVIGDSIAPVPAGLIDERRFDAERDLAPLPTGSPRAWRAERDRVAKPCHTWPRMAMSTGSESVWRYTMRQAAPNRVSCFGMTGASRRYPRWRRGSPLSLGELRRLSRSRPRTWHALRCCQRSGLSAPGGCAPSRGAAARGICPRAGTRCQIRQGLKKKTTHRRAQSK